MGLGVNCFILFGMVLVENLFVKFGSVVWGDFIFNLLIVGNLVWCVGDWYFWKIDDLSEIEWSKG